MPIDCMPISEAGDRDHEQRVAVHPGSVGELLVQDERRDATLPAANMSTPSPPKT